MTEQEVTIYRTKDGRFKKFVYTKMDSTIQRENKLKKERIARQKKKQVEARKKLNAKKKISVEKQPIKKTTVKSTVKKSRDMKPIKYRNSDKANMETNTPITNYKGLKVNPWTPSGGKTTRYYLDKKDWQQLGDLHVTYYKTGHVESVEFKGESRSNSWYNKNLYSTKVWIDIDAQAVHVDYCNDGAVTNSIRNGVRFYLKWGGIAH